MTLVRRIYVAKVGPVVDIQAHNVPWFDAIMQVLENSSQAMHYSDIAAAIAEQGLRTELGATPANSVNSIISKSLVDKGETSPFLRVNRGTYWLNSKNLASAIEAPVSGVPVVTEAGLINALGMYWERQKVIWNTANPRLMGMEQPGSTPVDFSSEKGVYLLHNGHTVIYVGRAIDQSIGIRLKQHTVDRLNGRWDRFSWFGVFPVTNTGSIDTFSLVGGFNLNSLIVTMEALLIEGLEPPQNRKRGDDFRAMEYLQVEDDDLRKDRMIDLIDELKKTIK